MFKASIVEEVVECNVCNHWMKVKCPSSNENTQKRANEVVEDKGWEAVGYGDKHICARCVDRLKGTDNYTDVKDELIEESKRANAPHDELAVIHIKDGVVQGVDFSSYRNMKFVVVDRDIHQFDDEHPHYNPVEVSGEDAVVYKAMAAHNQDSAVIDEITSFDGID